MAPEYWSFLSDTGPLLLSLLNLSRTMPTTWNTFSVWTLSWISICRTHLYLKYQVQIFNCLFHAFTWMSQTLFSLKMLKTVSASSLNLLFMPFIWFSCPFWCFSNENTRSHSWPSPSHPIQASNLVILFPKEATSALHHFLYCKPTPRHYTTSHKDLSNGTHSGLPVSMLVPL